MGNDGLVSWARVSIIEAGSEACDSGSRKPKAHAHLTLQLLPVCRKGSSAVAVQLLPLPAGVVGIEDKASCIVPVSMEVTSAVCLD